MNTKIFKKQIIKNNDSYNLTIFLPETYNTINYKIYNNKNILQKTLFVKWDRESQKISD